MPPTNTYYLLLTAYCLLLTTYYLLLTTYYSLLRGQVLECAMCTMRLAIRTVERAEDLGLFCPQGSVDPLLLSFSSLSLAQRAICTWRDAISQLRSPTEIAISQLSGEAAGPHAGPRMLRLHPPGPCAEFCLSSACTNWQRRGWRQNDAEVQKQAAFQL